PVRAVVEEELIRAEASEHEGNATQRPAVNLGDLQLDVGAGGSDGNGRVGGRQVERSRESVQRRDAGGATSRGVDPLPRGVVLENLTGRQGRLVNVDEGATEFELVQGGVESE